METGMKPRPISSQSKGFGRGTWLLPESWGLGLELMPAIHGYGHVIVRLWKGVGLCSEQCWWLLQRSGSATGHPPLPTVLPLGAYVLGGLVPSPLGRSQEHCWHICSAAILCSGSWGWVGGEWCDLYMEMSHSATHCSLPGINTVFFKVSGALEVELHCISSAQTLETRICSTVGDKVSVYDPKSPQNRKTPGSPYTNNYFSINDSLKPFPWQENALFCTISTG